MDTINIKDKVIEVSQQNVIKIPVKAYLTQIISRKNNILKEIEEIDAQLAEIEKSGIDINKEIANGII